MHIRNLCSALAFGLRTRLKIMFEIARFATHFLSQNCLGCFSKLNLGRKFYAEVATH